MIDKDQIIGKYFCMGQVEHSDTASAKGIDNSPPEGLIPYAVKLADEVLAPIWELVGPMSVNSWYRCAELNAAVGGSITPPSAHMECRACDFVTTSTTLSLREVFDKIKASPIPFDKMIIERNKKGGLWIHVQIRKDGGPARKVTLQAEFNQKLGKMEYTPA